MREGRYEAILFDLDGTLVDSTELILSSYRHTMRTHLGRQLPDADWLATMGQPLRVQLRDYARDESEAQAMLDTYSAHNDEHHDSTIAPFPGVLDLIRKLLDAGYPLGIATSKRREFALRGLRVCGLPVEWFGAIVTADDVERYKPDPEPLLVALAELGCESPSATMYVGDSPFDMAAGRAAGMDTVAVRWGPHDEASLARHSPSFTVGEPDDILRIVEARGRGTGQGV
jgi:pyrophosphatase PpaX